MVAAWMRRRCRRLARTDKAADPGTEVQEPRPRDHAHSRIFGHVDLYDRVNLIPWDKLTVFFNQHLTRG